MKSIRYIFTYIVLCSLVALQANAQQKADSSTIAKIRDEGMNHSQVMDMLSYISDVYGPRLAGSPEYTQAAKWAAEKMKALGLENVYLDSWGPLGKGWSLKHYEANIIGRQVFPLISYPKAWSPGVKGNAELLYIDTKADSTLASYKGKLKGKIVMIGNPVDVKAHWDPQARREADSSLLKLANADMPAQRGGGRRNFQMSDADKRRAMVTYQAWMLAQDEGALAVLSPSNGDGGTMFVQQATVPMHPDTPFTRRVSAYDPKAPKILPQITVGAEHYDRLVRMMARGEHPRLDIDLEVAFTKPESTYNIIGEIPGTDLKDEIVMIGAHYDSWHSGTGATDNATGSSVCLEAMRILKSLNLKPRRTIRIGLWGGEEEGLLGSAAYVKKYLGDRGGTFMNPGDNPKITLKPEADKFSVYFNNDNGSGKVRGIYMQGNEATRPIFRDWLTPFKDMGATTVTLSNTGSTDHVSFDAIGLPAFQFIQDPLEYDTRTHHSNMDVYERVSEEDVKQASVIMAAFAYQASIMDQKFPRKPAPQPRVAQGQ